MPEKVGWLSARHIQSTNHISVRYRVSLKKVFDVSNPHISPIDAKIALDFCG